MPHPFAGQGILTKSPKGAILVNQSRKLLALSAPSKKEEVFVLPPFREYSSHKGRRKGLAMRNLISLIYLSLVFGCSANHNTKAEFPTSTLTTYVDGNNDGNRLVEQSDYNRCLREEGYYDDDRNPNALTVCQELFAE